MCVCRCLPLFSCLLLQTFTQWFFIDMLNPTQDRFFFGGNAFCHITYSDCTLMYQFPGTCNLGFQPASSYDLSKLCGPYRFRASWSVNPPPIVNNCFCSSGFFVLAMMYSANCSSVSFASWNLFFFTSNLHLAIKMLSVSMMEVKPQ